MVVGQGRVWTLQAVAIHDGHARDEGHWYALRADREGHVWVYDDERVYTLAVGRAAVDCESRGVADG